MAVRPREQHNRPPVAGLEAAVDAVRLALHLLYQVMVAFDLGAARGCDLDEGELAAIAGTHFQKCLDSPKALRNALGVVDAVDANSHKSGGRARPGEQLGPFDVWKFLRLVVRVGLFYRDANGEWAD